MDKNTKKMKPKKKKKKINYDSLINLIFVICVLSMFGSVTLLRSYNVNLANRESAQQKDIETLNEDVSNLENKVKKLDNRDRILTIANENGLHFDQDQVVSVKEQK